MPKLQLSGTYQLDNNKLKSDTGLILHIRERQVTKGNARYFLAVHSPVFRYISNLYPAPTVEATNKLHNADSLKISDLAEWYLEYENQTYSLRLGDKTAEILATYTAKTTGDNVGDDIVRSTIDESLGSINALWLFDKPTTSPKTKSLLKQASDSLGLALESYVADNNKEAK